MGTEQIKEISSDTQGEFVEDLDLFTGKGMLALGINKCFIANNTSPSKVSTSVALSLFLARAYKGSQDD